MTTAPDTPLISGGPIRHRQPAWAVMPFVGDRAHYWRPESAPPGWPQGGDVRFWSSACGLYTTTAEGRTGRLEPGNWPRCKTCRRIRKRWEPGP